MEHYRDLIKSTQPRELAGIFDFLAKEEERHFNLFAAWEKMPELLENDDSAISEYAEKTFLALADHFETVGVPAIDHGDAYKKALEFENKSVQFYTDVLNGNSITNKTQRAILREIIDQEQLHARLIVSLMEFQRHPEEWLENAEWRHAEEF